MASGSDLHEETESRRSLLPSGVLHKRLKSDINKRHNTQVLVGRKKNSASKQGTTSRDGKQKFTKKIFCTPIFPE